MFTSDQSHLRRYLTTLGVAIAAGTLSLAGLFLKLQQDLTVTQSTLAKLTPTARATLLRRQDYLSLGTAILPWFVLVGFFGGVGLAAYGMIGWARRQKVIDEREDIGLHKERVELRQLTDTEKADKLDREAKESVKVPSPASSPPPSGRNLAYARTEINVIEHALIQKLREIYNPADVQSAVALQIPGQYFEVDAIARPGESDSVIFELKYASSAQNIMKRVIDGVRTLERATSRVAAAGVLVVVVADDATSEQIWHWNARAKEYATERRSVLGTYVGRRSDFLALPAKDFAVLVGLKDTKK
jgi:hypothetical protein